MEYISLIMLLLWGGGIWYFITLFRKNKKIKSDDLVTKQKRAVLDDEMSNCPTYSFLPGNAFYRFRNDD